MDANTIVTYATPVIVPLVIALVKKVKPNIPSVVIPIIAPILGAVIGIIASVATNNQGNIILAAVLGMAGVGLREIKDQLTKPSTEDKPE